MTDTQKQRIADRIVAVCDTERLMSRGELARRAEVSPAFITHIVAGKWDNYSNGAAIKLAIFRSIARVLGLDIDVFETANLEAIRLACSSAKMNHEYRVISGKVGAGKTFALADFVRNYPKHTYLVRCSALMTVKEFLKQVASACNVDVEASKNGLVDAIIQKLKMEEHPLILIDEAENLKDVGYAAIKDLYDGLEGIAGILLVGANRYYEFLQARARRGSSSTGRTVFPQLMSRFGTDPVVLADMTMEDVLAIVKGYQLGGKTEARQLFEASRSYRDLFARVRALVADRELAGQGLPTQTV